MKKTYLILLILFGIQVFGQTAKEIIDTHFEKTGGLDAWNSMGSIIIEGQVSIGVGDEFEIKIYHRRPNLKKVVYIIAGKEQLNEGFDGKNAYTYNPETGKNQPLPNYKPDAFETDILNYESKGFKAELVGEEIVNNKMCYKIQLTKNTVIDFLWFDKETYYLLKETNNVETTFYKGFKPFKGLIFATRMESTPIGGKEYVVIFNQVIPFAAIDEKEFKF